ncbi:large with RING domain [Cryptosporidium sp. chipmunk genotype I]|uniref:large with RING domain n=1 Tax=Cryptosporidium sp. chipmunk genotype I TaxID=1280935 RepID=UPI00351A803C|nr:large with RING domain [Cryptosporidium sp. chipmunk genotype I]
MSVTLGSILFPERRKVVIDTKKGLHNKRKKQVNAQKSQEQTSKQFTTRLLLDDETIAPNDFLTPFPSDDVRNTEQFWEYLERVFYPVDERWISVLDLSARPQNLEPKEACIGLHFAYRWALVDLFDISELFKLVGNRNKIFKNIVEISKDSSSENRASSSGGSRFGGEDKVLDQSGNLQLDSLESSDLVEERKVLSYLEFLDLPILELIGIDTTMLGGVNTNLGNLNQNRGALNNPYFEEWKFLYKRLSYIEKEVDSMLLKLTNSVCENIHKDNSRKLLQRHQKKKCREFLLKVMHYHSMRQFVDSLEEVLYFDEKTGLYLTTWDDGEAVRAAWMSQDQLLQLLLFRPNSTESKYSVSIPSEYIPYAKSLDTHWLKYFLDSGLTMISDHSNNSQDNDRLGDTLNLDTPSKPKDGCIELSRHPLCHYCRRSCKRLNYSRCPSKLKPLNLGINPSGLSQTTQTQNSGSNSVINNSNSLKLSGTSTSTSTSNIYYSRSLIPWRVPKSQNNIENSGHSEPAYISNSHYNQNQFSFVSKSGKSIKLNNRSSIGGNSCGSGASYLLGVNRSHVCNICIDFESTLNESGSVTQEEILVSRAYSPNNCWRMYCSECIMHNFSSVIKQKYSNGVVLRYYCPFCSGACNCERCLRNQQIRKIKNYLKSRFCGYIFQCSISSCVIQNELSWFDFLKDFGGTSLLFPHTNNGKENNNLTGDEVALVNDLGEIDESMVNISNIAVVSYINNPNRRLSIAENTHLGFIWLQANNIPFQKPLSSSGGNMGLNDPNSKKTTTICGTLSGSNTSDPTKLISKNKSRNNRSSINGIQKNKRNSSIQSNFEEGESGNLSITKFQQITQSVPSNSSILSSNVHRSTFNIKGSGAQNLPPSIHVPREVVNEPTHASGASVLWSLRSILINNVNKYHKECLNNLERWESIQELYSRKRMELESYFEELLSKLNLMDDWIRSLSFTETNKRFIMRKMPLLCWATDIPSAKAFNFDDFPQLLPNNNVIEMIKHIQNFVNNGIISDNLPTHQILGLSEVSESDGINGVSQKTTPSLKLIDRLPGMATSNSPSSVMEFLMNSISEIQNIVVKTNNNSSKDESAKANKIQRSSKKDKSNSKNPTQNNKLPGCDIVNPDEVKVSSCINDLVSSSLSCSTAEADGNHLNSNSPINAEFLSKNQGILETVSSTGQNGSSLTSRPSVEGLIQNPDGSHLPNFDLVKNHNSSNNPFIHVGNDSYMLDEGSIDAFQSYSSKTVPNQDPGIIDSVLNKSRKRRSSLELASEEMLTPERKRKLALKRKRDRETIRKAMKKSSNPSSSNPTSPDAIGGMGFNSIEEINSLSGDCTAFSVSSNESSYGSPQV